jgi:hypothetical protein
MWTDVFRKRWKAILIGAAGGTVLAVAGVYLQNDWYRNALDPKVPFQIYQATRLPKAPDYRKAASWYLNPALARYYADPRKVDVFFLHGTTFDGGKDWLGGIDGPASRDVERIQIPNYAGPFSVMGNVYAPRYRQASLYTQLTGRDDAREARRFAYGDAEAAFRAFLKQRKGGRGFIIVGVEQGGLLAERLLRDEVASKPEVRSQLVGAYLLETLAPQAPFAGPAGIPVCGARDATGCVVAYLSVDSGRPDQALQVLKRAVAWEGNNDLVTLSADKAVCVNPLAGAPTNGEVDAHHSQGATNATGLEWGAEPALLLHKVSARCLSGLLIVDKPDSPTFRDGPAWVDQRKVNPYNLFYGDLQADMQARWQAFQNKPLAQTN